MRRSHANGEKNINVCENNFRDKQLELRKWGPVDSQECPGDSRRGAANNAHPCAKSRNSLAKFTSAKNLFLCVSSSHSFAKINSLM
jgi:hypothetical protein